MSERPTLKTVVRGEHVELPGTLADIRASLPEDRRAAFDAEIDNAPVVQVPVIAARWATPPELEADVEADVERIRAGDFTGLVNPDGTPFVP